MFQKPEEHTHAAAVFVPAGEEGSTTPHERHFGFTPEVSFHPPAEHSADVAMQRAVGGSHIVIAPAATGVPVILTFAVERVVEPVAARAAGVPVIVPTNIPSAVAVMTASFVVSEPPRAEPRIVIVSPGT